MGPHLTLKPGALLQARCHPRLLLSNAYKLPSTLLHKGQAGLCCVWVETALGVTLRFNVQVLGKGISISVNQIRLDTLEGKRR
eukprot:m.27824 g.27824  ORF g.27824 m.27824 type:complete len:83 (+) comp6479_c0_seq1:114-362(+)